MTDTAENTAPAANAADTKNRTVPKFTPRNDWITKLLDKHCAHPPVAEGEVKPESKVNLDGLWKFAGENGFVRKEYPNPGMARMNVGNMLRAAARKRHGLMSNGEFVPASDDFPVDERKSETPDGTKIKNIVPETMDEKAAAAA